VNLTVFVVVQLILFGGGGFCYGGPYVGGGFGTILLIVLIVLMMPGASAAHANEQFNRSTARFVRRTCGPSKELRKAGEMGKTTAPF
jgi:hypothetical protein